MISTTQLDIWNGFSQKVKEKSVLIVPLSWNPSQHSFDILMSIFLGYLINEWKLNSQDLDPYVNISMYIVENY